MNNPKNGDILFKEETGRMYTFFDDKVFPIDNKVNISRGTHIDTSHWEEYRIVGSTLDVLRDVLDDEAMIAKYLGVPKNITATEVKTLTLDKVKELEEIFRYSKPTAYPAKMVTWTDTSTDVVFVDEGEE